MDQVSGGHASETSAEAFGENRWVESRRVKLLSEEFGTVDHRLRSKIYPNSESEAWH